VNEVMIFAGESSSDHHAAKLVRALERAGVHCYGLGGDRMIAEGFEPVAHAKDISVMGFVEVVRHLPRILGVKRRLIEAAAVRRPRVAVLLDLPDFNLRVARALKRLGVYVIYYISPQVWAWRPSRVDQIRRTVDEMLCILPFEEPFYRARQVAARFVGHPLVEDLRERPNGEALKKVAPGAPLIGLLPGSRRQEAARLLETMFAAAEQVLAAMPEARFVLPRAGTTALAQIEAALRRHPKVRERTTIVEGRAPEVLAAADSAVVASGTATLEAALIGVPTIAIYRIGRVTFAILRRIVTVSSVILANLILGEQRQLELLQDDCNPKRIGDTLLAYVNGPEARARAEMTRADLLRELGAHQPTHEVTKSVLRALEAQRS
jgi:lipid-A-disaccharide synthase